MIKNIKKMINKWLWLPGCIAFFAGVFPEGLSKINASTRLLLIVIGIFSITVWTIISKFYSYCVERWRYFWIMRKRIKIGVYIENKDLTDNIVNFCNEEILKIKLSRKIVFEQYDVNPRNLKKIHKNISSKTNLDLVVSMMVNNSNKGKVPINFSYKNTHDNLIARIVHSQMSSLVSIEKMFNFNKDTFVVDLELEKENIANFSLYIVAICTTIFRGSNDGILIFEKLISKLSDSKSSLKNEVSVKLGELYMIKGGDLLARGNFPQSLRIFNKSYELIPSNRDLLAGLALSQFINGDEVGAEKTAGLLISNNTNFPVAHLDFAFFRIKNKKYKSAIRHYSIFAKYNKDGRVVIDAINFFSNRIEENNSELAYLFARGFIKRTINKDPRLTRVGDSDYVEDFTVFIRRAGSKMQYKDMVDVAIKYINRVPKN